MGGGDPNSERLLEVRGLSIVHAGAAAPAVDGVDLTLDPGEVVGIVGESGSGKTTLALSLLGLLPAAARVTAGSIRLRGRELLGLSEAELEGVRGAQLSLVPQEPGVALNPVLRAGVQLEEVLRAHGRQDPAARRDEVLRLLAEVGLRDEARVAASYPHELSGGERQRVAVAQAIACRPAVVVADEPTSALDASTQAALLSLFAELRRRLGLAFVLVTHDLGALAALADRVLVMYAGRIVEAGPLSRVLAEPWHPYTRALLAAVPGPRGPGGERRLPVVAGSPPAAGVRAPGCAFEPRCAERLERCASSAPSLDERRDRSVRCFLYG
ncbi:MAG: ABC transporter ATP-binding protein [Vicinamibacteria bacterium]